MGSAMPLRILRIQEIVQKTGLSRRTVYTEISEGRFPKPVQLSSRRVGWPEDEVDAWLAEKVTHRTPPTGKVIASSEAR